MALKLTTHVLDTAHGRPGAGIAVVLTCDGEEVARTTTNADGRTDEPLIDGGDVAGVYELTFAVGDYFGADRGYLDEVPIRVVLDPSMGHVHVALLVTPWSYTTYRGS